MANNQTKAALKTRIKELEAEVGELKAEIKQLKSTGQGFYTLKHQFDAAVELGEFTQELPSFIPEHKKWSARDYPNEWRPEQKAADYLITFWRNYPVSQSYFSNVRGGQSFYKYLKRNGLFNLLPDAFQLELKKRLHQSNPIEGRQ